jgi:hypothetical protein
MNIIKFLLNQLKMKREVDLIPTIGQLIQSESDVKFRKTYLALKKAK